MFPDLGILGTANREISIVLSKQVFVSVKIATLDEEFSAENFEEFLIL